MARFEALLAPASNASDWRAVIDQLAQEWQGAADWLDGRNASLTVHVAPTGLQVKLLLELQPSGQLGVLVSSREGMGGGAVQTKEVLGSASGHPGALAAWGAGGVPLRPRRPHSSTGLTQQKGD
jgi:hypothetical protein